LGKTIFVGIMTPDTWLSLDRAIILASQSPRRKQLLAQMGFEFETVCPRLEDEQSFIDPSQLEHSLCRLAEAKAASVSQDYPRHLVLGTDTVVVRDDAVLGKPQSRSEAEAMLRSLGAREHRVVSGVALLCQEANFCCSTTVSTVVAFGEINERALQWYLDSGDYRDKAGSYGIQGSAMIFIQHIKGCFYNVVGLPVEATLSLFDTYCTTRKVREDG
jgi:septum formation protein